VPARVNGSDKSVAPPTLPVIVVPFWQAWLHPTYVPTPPMSSVDPNIWLFHAIRLPTPTIRALSRQTALSIAAKVGIYIKKCWTRQARRASWPAEAAVAAGTKSQRFR
jgi:hypothetical protein